MLATVKTCAVVRHDGNLGLAAFVVGIARDLPAQEIEEAHPEWGPGVVEASGLAVGGEEKRPILDACLREELSWRRTRKDERSQNKEKTHARKEALRVPRVKPGAVPLPSASSPGPRSEGSSLLSGRVAPVVASRMGELQGTLDLRRCPGSLGRGPEGEARVARGLQPPLRQDGAGYPAGGLKETNGGSDIRRRKGISPALPPWSDDFSPR